MARRFFRIVLALAAASFFVTAAWAEELRIGVKTEPSSMDPHFHNLGPNNAFMTNVFGRLIDMDYQQHLKPDLAVSWKPINDTTWEIKLRKGVKFSDGSPFTADDVIFSFERAVNMSAAIRASAPISAARPSRRSTITPFRPSPKSPIR